MLPASGAGAHSPWSSGKQLLQRAAATLSHKHKHERHASQARPQHGAWLRDIWPKLEAYNQLDAQARGDWLVTQGLPTSDPELVRIITKSHFVIPGKTRHRCVQCGECCRYARKTATFTYDPCPFLDEHNQCSKHASRYNVCKWFPFWLFDGGSWGPLLTSNPTAPAMDKATSSITPEPSGACPS